jgi:3-methyl-2-oxobutanoate hydroxymethyltransferase
MFGFFEDFKPKFAKEYMPGAKLIRDALGQYVYEVKNRQFPDEEHTY